MAASLVLLCPDPSAKSPRGPRKQTGSPGLLPQGPRDVFRAAAQVKSPPGGPLSSHTRLSSMEVPLPIFGLVCKFYTAGVPPTRASMSMHSRTLRCHSCPPPMTLHGQQCLPGAEMSENSREKPSPACSLVCLSVHP